MSWQLEIESVHKMLNAARMPSSLDIISLIKKVNPTKLCLSESDRERGYEVKAKLQNLLLENYGETFYLAPHPFSENIVLIKHTALPSIDACHAELASLSVKALDTVALPAPKLPEKKAVKQTRKDKGKNKGTDGGSSKDALQEAQRLLEEYEYAEAEAVLAGIRITAGDELVILERGVGMLVQEMGAYQRAIETLLAQPRQIIREKSIRELLALTYYQNGMLPEARAIFHAFHPHELGKEALFAYAQLSYKDGNLSLAFKLLAVADEMEGYLPASADLRNDIETGMLAEAEPVLQRALKALDLGEVAEAESLARQVLAYYPNHHKAREMVNLIGSGREASEIAGLWEKYRRAVKSEEKTDLLARLLERDRENRETITALLAEEKAGQKKKLLESRLDELRRLAEEENWRECYDILHWLSTQKGHSEEYREACTVSAFFSVLYQNRRLRMLAERTAKEVWLDFVKAKSSLLSGRQKGCFEIMEGIKQYFQPYPEFTEDYLRLLGVEQERARVEIGDLMQQAEAGSCTVPRIDGIFSSIRKTMAILPSGERCEYGRSMEARLALLTRDQTRDAQLEAYREALQTGNVRKAELLRQEISDQSALERIDAEISELFRIDSQPVTLTISDHLPVDLDSDPPLRWLNSTDRQIMLGEEDGSIVMVNLEQLSATRFISSKLKDIVPCDALPGQDTFLFRELPDLGTAWRAELSNCKSAFTACFDLHEKLGLEIGDCAAQLHMSSDKATDYYTSVVHKDFRKPGEVIKQRMGSRNGASAAVPIKEQPYVFIKRASSEPDMFLLGVEDETRMCNKNLTTEVSVAMTPKIWEVDQLAGHIYYFYSHMLKRVDFGFNDYQEFPESGGCFFMDKHRVLGLCPAKATVMVGLRARAAFYNFSNNSISTPFRLGRVICTRPARKYYCYDYCQQSRELTLREITAELEDLLQWTQLHDMRKNDGTEEDLATLYEQIYFGYKADEPASETPDRVGALCGDEASSPLLRAVHDGLEEDA